MRKILSLIVLMLATFTGTAWGSLPTSDLVASTTGNEITFYIRHNANGMSYYFNSNTAPTRTASEYAKFAFYAADGVTDGYYIKCVDTGKWLSYDNTAITSGPNFVTFSDTQENYFIVSKVANYYFIRPVNASGSADNYFNWHGGAASYNASNTVGLYNSTSDNGSKWTLVQTDKIITDLSQISANKYYAITSFRAGLAVNEAGTAATARNSGKATDKADKWAFVTYGGKNYLYNLESKNFLQAGAGMGSMSDDFTYSEWASTDGFYKYHFVASNTGNTINMQTSGILINDYSTADDGNRFMIVEIGDFDATEPLAELVAIYKQEILTKITPLSFLHNYDDIVAAINAATTEAGVDAAVEGFNNDFITVKNYQTGNYFEVGNPNCSYNGSPSSYSNYVQLVSAGKGEFYLKGYNSQRYAGDVLTSTQVTTDDTPTTSFWIQQNTAGRYILRPAKYAAFSDQSGYHYLHNNGCVGWEAGANNSQHLLYEVANPEEPTVDVTYELYYDNAKVDEVVVPSNVGFPTAVPDKYQINSVTLTYSAPKVTGNGQVVRVDATWNGPFKLSKSFSDATWYQIKVLRNPVKYSKFDGTNISNSTTVPSTLKKEDLFAFVGSPFGFSLYNGKAGAEAPFGPKAYSSSNKLTKSTVADAAVLVFEYSTEAGYESYQLIRYFDNALGYINDSSNKLAVWQTSNNRHDAGSNFEFVEVDAAVADDIVNQLDVVFNIVDESDNLLGTRTATVRIGELTTVPEDIQLDYYTATLTAPVTITSEGASTTPVIRVSNWNGPFEISNTLDDNASWYVFNIRNTTIGLIVENENDLSVTTSYSIDHVLADNVWAFKGNNVTGFSVYNKSKGLYLTKPNGGYCTLSTTPNTDWLIMPTGSNTANGNGAFLLYEKSDRTHKLNQYGGASSHNLGYYNSSTDQGNFFYVSSSEEYVKGVIEVMLANPVGLVYSLDTEANKTAFQTQYDNIKATASLAELVTLYNTISNAQIKPVTGWYQIENLYSANNFVIEAAADGSVIGRQTITEGANDINTFVKYDATTQVLSIQGKNIPLHTSSGEGIVLTDEAGGKVFMAPAAAGSANLAIYFTETDNSYKNLYFNYSQTPYTLRSWYSITESNCRWFVHPKTAFDITLHAAESNYWATLYAPFGVTLPTGTEAYVGKINEGGNLQLTSIGQDVPAGTAVILCGDAESITATINDAIPAFTGENALQGQYLAADAADDTKLTLGKKDDKVGFYTIDSALGANKAYLTASAGAKGFQIVFSDDDITGIQEFENSEVRESECYYDLTGRKVAAPQKGQLYIVNGKVVKY